MKTTVLGLPIWFAILVLLVSTVSFSIDLWVDWRSGMLVAGAIALGAFIQEWLDD